MTRGLDEDLIEVQLLTDEKLVRETLSRMGIANKKTKTIYPSVYLYQNYEKFYLVHFKTLFLLTRQNGYNNLSDDDKIRRNSIVFLLKKWGFVDLDEEDIFPHNYKIFVLPHKEKNEWVIEHKFNVNSIQVKN